MYAPSPVPLSVTILTVRPKFPGRCLSLLICVERGTTDFSLFARTLSQSRPYVLGICDTVLRYLNRNSSSSINSFRIIPTFDPAQKRRWQSPQSPIGHIPPNPSIGLASARRSFLRPPCRHTGSAP